MRAGRSWWRNLVFLIDHNPPAFVEYLMMSFAVAFGMRWFFSRDEWPYLVLSSSFIIGSAISMWVREMLLPSPRKPEVVVSVILLLAYSLYSFVFLAKTYVFYR